VDRSVQRRYLSPLARTASARSQITNLCATETLDSGRPGQVPGSASALTSFMRTGGMRRESVRMTGVRAFAARRFRGRRFCVLIEMTYEGRRLDDDRRQMLTAEMRIAGARADRDVAVTISPDAISIVTDGNDFLGLSRERAEWRPYLYAQGPPLGT
jgi:hypothetical protein